MRKIIGLILCVLILFSTIVIAVDPPASTTTTVFNRPYSQVSATLRQMQQTNDIALQPNEDGSYSGAVAARGNTYYPQSDGSLIEFHNGFDGTAVARIRYTGNNFERQENIPASQATVDPVMSRIGRALHSLDLEYDPSTGNYRREGAYDRNINGDSGQYLIQQDGSIYNGNMLRTLPYDRLDTIEPQQWNMWDGTRNTPYVAPPVTPPPAVPVTPAPPTTPVSSPIPLALSGTQFGSTYTLNQLTTEKGLSEDNVYYVTEYSLLNTPSGRPTNLQTDEEGFVFKRTAPNGRYMLVEDRNGEARILTKSIRSDGTTGYSWPNNDEDPIFSSSLLATISSQNELVLIGGGSNSIDIPDNMRQRATAIAIPPPITPAPTPPQPRNTYIVEPQLEGQTAGGAQVFTIQQVTRENLGAAGNQIRETRSQPMRFTIPQGAVIPGTTTPYDQASLQALAQSQSGALQNNDAFLRALPVGSSIITYPTTGAGGISSVTLQGDNKYSIAAVQRFSYETTDSSGKKVINFGNLNYDNGGILVQQDYKFDYKTGSTVQPIYASYVKPSSLFGGTVVLRNADGTERKPPTPPAASASQQIKDEYATDKANYDAQLAAAEQFAETVIAPAAKTAKDQMLEDIRISHAIQKQKDSYFTQAQEALKAISYSAEGFSGYSSLFMSEQDINSWREGRDEAFAKFYLGSQYWASGLCKQKLDVPNKQVAFYENPSTGRTRISATISGEKLTAVSDGQLTTFLYKIELYVVNPRDSYSDRQENQDFPDMCVQAYLMPGSVPIFVSPDSAGTPNPQPQNFCIGQGDVLSRSGASALVTYSTNDYNEICLYMYNAPTFLTGTNPLCNRIVLRTTQATVLPGSSVTGGAAGAGGQQQTGPVMNTI